MVTTDKLDEKYMLGPFYKSYADLGHWFNKRSTECIYCKTPAIDLFEDSWYGPVRRCIKENLN